MVLLLACGSSAGGGGDDGDDGDGTGSVDAPLVAPDANPAVTVDVLSMCQEYTRTVTESTGARLVYRSRWASIAAVGPDDEFRLLQCGPTPNVFAGGECSPTQTCSGSTLPPGAYCSVATSGTFIDNKLAINCGYTYESYAANGTLQSTSTFTWQSITVTY
jgi:hypothetical protein